MAGARFAHINLIVRNMKETMGFYRLLGVEIPEGAAWRSGGQEHHAQAVTDGAVSLGFDSRKLAQAYNSGLSAERGRVVIGIELESRAAVDAMWVNLINEGAQGLQPPYDAFWGARYAIVEDPDGNPVGLSSPSDPAMVSAPPPL